MSIETLALDSYISDFATDETEPVIFFGGNDWYDMPVIDESVDFKISCEIYWPSQESYEGDYKGVLVFGETTGSPDCYIGLMIRNQSLPYVQLRWTPDNGDQSSINTDTINHDEWTKIEIERDGDTIYVRRWTAAGVLSEASTDIDDPLTLTTGTLGGIRSWWWAGNGDAADFLPYDTFIRRLSGTGLGFGSVYKDDAATRFATIDDNVAVIANSGSLGGDFSQETAAARGLVTAFIAPANKSLSALTSGVASELGLNSGVETAISLGSGIETNIELISGVSGNGYKCGTFDGSTSYVEIDDNDLFSFTDNVDDKPFTLMAWINLVDATNKTIMSKYDTSGSAREWIFYSNSQDRLDLILYDEDNTAYIRSNSYEKLTTHEDAWVHVAATYSGSGVDSGIKFYINSDLTSLIPSTIGSYSSMLNDNAPVLIGQSDETWYINGKMRDVKIFDVEFSAAEILTEYDSNNRNADLVVHYKLYDDVNDSGTNELDGVNNSVTFEAIAPLSLVSSLL